MTHTLLDAASADESSSAPSVPARAAWFGLAVLTLINLFNYLDRFVVPALGESLKHSELRLTDQQFGFLASGFIVVYMLTAPLIGAFGDRGSRPRLIAMGVAVWSVATALGGVVSGYIPLLASRGAVGIGEAAYGTIAPALLADYFPPRFRGRVFAIFFAAIPVGSALGYVVGGVIDRWYGWRYAFFVAGLPGLLLALLVLRLADPGRETRRQQPLTRSEGAPKLDAIRTYRSLLAQPLYVLTVLGYAAYTFALGGISVWMPTFLERVRGLPRVQATVQLGAVLVVTGFVGTFAGGWIADFIFKRTKWAYLWVSGIATVAAAPLAYVALASPSPTVYWTALVIAEVLVFACTGPINSAIVSEVAPGVRASAMALSILAIHILGDVPSPPLIGAISDAASLEQAVLIIPAAIAIAGVIWTWTAARGQRQERRSEAHPILP